MHRSAIARRRMDKRQHNPSISTRQILSMRDHHGLFRLGEREHGNLRRIRLAVAFTFTIDMATDTSVQADRHLFVFLRQRIPQQRIALSQGGFTISLGGLKQRFGHLDQDEFTQKMAQAWLGKDWPVGFLPKGDLMTWIQDSIGLARRLHALFAALEVEYYVMGGVASTVYGEPRLTIDLALVINVAGEELYPLVALSMLTGSMFLELRMPFQAISKRYKSRTRKRLNGLI